MAVSTTTNVEDGLYVPYRTGRRGGEDGSDPVGTLFVNAEATGDATGGTLTVKIKMRSQEFGFPAVWVPTLVVLLDDLAAVETPLFQFASTGQERLSVSVHEAILSVRGGGTSNTAVVDALGVAIDPDLVAGGDVMIAIWASNTDTKSYHIHAYGPIWDGQLLAMSQGRIPDILAGVR